MRRWEEDLRVEFDARVCRAGVGPKGQVLASVEFAELSTAERRVFQRWQQLLVRRDGTTRVAANVAPAVEIDVPSNWHQGSWRA